MLTLRFQTRPVNAVENRWQPGKTGIYWR